MNTLPSRAAAPLRRSVVGRDPIGRVPFMVPGRRRWLRLPRWLLRFVASQLLLLTLLSLLAEWQKPASLPESVLVGPRLATGPICVDEAVDVSSSMTPYIAQREDAERALVDLARRQLSPSDTIAIAFFTGKAGLALPPTGLEKVTAPPPPPPDVLRFGGTMLAPAVDVLQRARRNVGAPVCAARALVVITDGEIFDAEDTARALTDAAYTRVYAVVPAGSGWGRPAPLQGDLSSVVVYHFTGKGPGAFAASILADARPLDVVYGDVVGSLTGQKLEQVERPR